MNDIYLLIEGQQQGAYTEDQVRQSLSEGLIPGDLPAWHEGLPEWVTVESLYGLSSVSSVGLASQARHLDRGVSKEQVAYQARPPDTLRSQYERPAQIYKYLAFGAAGLAILGFSIGIGIGLKMHTLLPEPSKVALAKASPSPTSDASGPPDYIYRVVDHNAGVDGIIVCVEFHDSRDRETFAEGKITVTIEANGKNPYDPLELTTQTFDITKNDFKVTDYGLWSAYMVTLPRIKYDAYFASEHPWGAAKVHFISTDGKVLEGEDNSVHLVP